MSIYARLYELNINRKRKRADVVSLMRLLRHRNAYIRRRAAAALGQLRDLRSEDELIALLDDADHRVREAAAAALGKIGDLKALEPLAAALHDERCLVRKAAADALGEIGSRLVAELDKALSSDKDSAAWEAAGEVLALPVCSLSHDYLRLLRRLGECKSRDLSTLKSTSVEPLVSALEFCLACVAACQMEAGEPKVRDAAAAALGRITGNMKAASMPASAERCRCGISGNKF